MVHSISSDKDKFLQYQRTTSYKNLVNDHNLNDEAIWQVYGEDPNCDFVGSHHQPFLGLYSGKLIDVIRYAVELPDFWQWGSGGDIKKLPKPIVITANSVNEQKNAIEQIAQLTEQIAIIKAKHYIK